MLSPCNLLAAIIVAVQYSGYLRYQDICFVDSLEIYTLSVATVNLRD